MNQADVLNAFLESDTSTGHASASVRALVSMADEVSDALSSLRLSRVDQERIYARCLAMLEEAVHEQRRSPDPGRRRDRLGGAAQPPPRRAGGGLTSARPALGLWACPPMTASPSTS
jgi:hypothetical protein